MDSATHYHIVILVVEDEALLREVVVEALAEEGFTVVEAANATEALAQLERRSDVRLLFTDIQMPGEPDGLGLLEVVHERWPHMLLMVTSGRLRPLSEDLPDDARFVPKPFNQSEIMRQIGDLVSKHPERAGL